MAEDLDDHRRIFDGRDHRQSAAAVRAAVRCRYARNEHLHKIRRPRQASRVRHVFVQCCVSYIAPCMLRWRACEPSPDILFNCPARRQQKTYFSADFFLLPKSGSRESSELSVILCKRRRSFRSHSSWRLRCREDHLIAEQVSMANKKHSESSADKAEQGRRNQILGDMAEGHVTVVILKWAL